MNTRLKYQLSALDRCIESQRAFAREVEKANPSDAYAALMIHEDIGQLDALHARLAVVGAALSAADAVRDESASGAVDDLNLEYAIRFFDGWFDGEGDEVMRNWHKISLAIAALRQPVTAQQPAAAVHDSDCAIHDAPAYPAGLCDCNASTEPAAAEYTPGDYGMEVGATTHTPAAPLPLAYVAEVVQAQPDPGLGGLRGKCLSWPKGMVNFIVESAPGTRLYTKSLASNAGVPEGLRDFLSAKMHHLPVEDQHVLSVFLAAALPHRS